MLNFIPNLKFVVKFPRKYLEEIQEFMFYFENFNNISRISVKATLSKHDYNKLLELTHKIDNTIMEVAIRDLLLKSFAPATSEYFAALKFADSSIHITNCYPLYMYLCALSELRQEGISMFPIAHVVYLHQRIDDLRFYFPNDEEFSKFIEDKPFKY